MSTFGRISLLGTGLMGSRMALHVLRKNGSLTIWNRTPEKASSLVEAGASLANSAADACRDADFVIFMLANGPTVTEVLEDEPLLRQLKPGSVLMDMSSIPPDLACRHAETLAQREVAYLDAPVSGGTVGAEEATLAILAGGDKTAFDQAEPVFATMGNPTHMGPSGSGQLSKLCNQIMVAVTLTGVAEAFLFASEAGVDLPSLQKALSGGFADSRILREHGRRLIERDFNPGGTAENQLKDVNTALANARELGLQLPATETVQSLFAGLSEAGQMRLDHTAILMHLERINGQEPTP
ncbi:MAG: NAD(P)-dependent oxidoreductase [Verrucomicrobiota bacterium]